jgi:2'-5' RNA ligase
MAGNRSHRPPRTPQTGGSDRASNQSAEIRSFIAIEIPSDVRRFLSDLISQLKRTGADVKWVRPESIHLTLKFLGNVRADLIPQIAATIAPAFVDFAPAAVSASGVGVFPGMRRPRVVWAGVTDPGGRLAGLASNIENRLEPLGFEREQRSFNPHLTLGRVNSGRGASELADTITRLADAQGPSFTAEHAVLFQSVLTPAGAVYTPWSRFDFASPR